jgi:hypothetical protein
LVASVEPGARTHEKMMMSFSLPWYESTVDISTWARVGPKRSLKRDLRRRRWER